MVPVTVVVFVSIVTAVEASISTVGALNCNVTSASISSCPSADELILRALSRNCNWLVEFNNNPVSATWVRVISLSAPNEITAASLNKRTSSPTDKYFTIPTPPATVKAPFVAVEDSVVSETITPPSKRELPESIHNEKLFVMVWFEPAIIGPWI